MTLTRLMKFSALALSANLLVSLCAATVAAQTLAGSSTRRVVEVLDPGNRIALPGKVRPWIKKASDLGELPGGTAAPHMLLLLQRSPQQEQGLEEYLSDLQNPASSNYHRWLTPAQFADAYGVDADDVHAVTGWLQSEGFTIDRISKAMNLVEFSGTAGQLERAFGAEIHRLSFRGKLEATSMNGVQIPRALAPVIRGLVNLDSVHAHPLVEQGSKGRYDPSTHRIKTEIQPNLTIFGGGAPSLYVDPADAAVIYDTPNAALNPKYTGNTLDGTGLTLGVVGVSNVDLTAVSLYRQAFLGEKSGNVNLPTVVVDGNDPGLNNAEIESWLDLELLGGLAPKAKIIYYASNETDLADGLDTAIVRAVEDNAISILSISYGACEADLGTSGNAFFSEVYQQAAAQGITVAVSSGDSGSASCDLDSAPTAVNGLTVSGLASTPYNIAVGGTDFDVLSSNFATYANDQTSGSAPYYLTALKYIPEEPWNDSTIVNTSIASDVPLEPNGVTNIIAGGGGASSVYGKPAFQGTLTPKDGARDLPDVSFLAANGLYGASWVLCEASVEGNDCETVNGQLTDSSTVHGAGGTSASTPAFAGMLALVEQATGSRLGQANNILYQLAASKYATVFHDSLTGNNSVVCGSGSPDCGSNGFLTGYNAGTGYDLATGLGSVDAAAMVKNWTSAVTTATTTTLSINGATTPISVTHGTTLDLHVGVEPGAVTGTAALVANTSSLSGQLAIPISGGTGSANYNGLPGGSYTVYARYGGNETDAASSSTPVSVSIAPEASTTGLAINAYNPATGNPISSTSSIPYGSLTFAEATVFGTAEGQANSQGQATGSITYSDNGQKLGTQAISSFGTASYPNYALGFYFFPGGKHSVTASFPGDTSYKTSTSGAAVFTIAKGLTQVQVSANPASTTSVRNDTITVIINTVSVGDGPTGTVTLQANGVTLGTTTNIVPQGNAATGYIEGAATFTVAGSALQPGTNVLSVTYTGDGNYDGGTATGSVTVSVATFSLSTSAINITAGSTNENTAVIRATPLNDFTGVVNLACSVTTSPANATSPVTCAVPASINLTGLNAVTGTLTVNSTGSTTSGTYVITVSGADAATGKIKTSTTSTVTVTGSIATPALALSNSGNISIAPGATSGNASTITVTPSGGFTGAVALTCSVTSPAGAIDPVSCSLSNASVNISGSAAGMSTLTVTSSAASPAALRSGLGIVAAVTALLLLLLPGRRRMVRGSRTLAGVVAVVALAGIMSGCGGSSHTTTPPANPGTSAGTYVVTITGTASGVTVASTTVNVIVN